MDSNRKKGIFRKISGGLIIAYSSFTITSILLFLLGIFLLALISLLFMNLFKGTDGWGPLFYLASYGMFVGSIALGIIMIFYLIIIILLLVAGIFIIQGRYRVYSFAILCLNISLSILSILSYLFLSFGEPVGSVIRNIIPLVFPVLIFGFCMFCTIYGWDTFVSGKKWKEMKEERLQIREENREREKRKREMERSRRHYYEDHWIEPEVRSDNPVEDSDGKIDDYYLEKWGRSYYDY